MMVVDPDWVNWEDSHNVSLPSTSTGVEFEADLTDDDEVTTWDENFVLHDYMQMLRGEDGPVLSIGEHNKRPDLSFLEAEAATMIFDGADVSRLEIIFLLLSIQTEKKISNIAIDAIFQTISEKVIPSHFNSKMPKSRAEARKILTDVGLDYKLYDACPCDETLYYGPIKANWKFCPKCNLSRYTDTTQKKNVPRKVTKSIQKRCRLNICCQINYFQK